jgi:tetratricopeptide (TPR) repeat protein
LATSATPVVLADVPFHPQEAHHCGPASLLSQLEAAGVSTDYNEIVERVYIPGLEGSLQVEMLAAARSYGQITYVLPPAPQAILAEVAFGRPVLVLLNLGLPQRPVWHYALVVGFDPARNEIVLHSGDTARSRQKGRAWLRRWDWAGRWAAVLLAPGDWPAEVERDRLLSALAAFDEAASPEAAESAWRSAAERWAEEPVVWIGIGNAAYRQGELPRAAEAFRTALAIDPDHLPARLNLAEVLAEGGASCEALRALGVAPAEEHPLRPAWVGLEARVRTLCDAVR